MSTTDPPLGSGFAFRHDDPADEHEAERANRHLDRADRFGEQERQLPGTPRDLEEKAEEIVVREQGVNSFAHAEEVDRMERPPSVND